MAIGPHIGEELELMLAGSKKLAAFGDIIPDDGEINEEIIPEKAFTPYVTAGRIIRFEKLINGPMVGGETRLFKSVCFTLPGEEWRAHFWHWYKERLFAKNHQYAPSDEYILGHLLGYEDVDIDEFVERMALKKAQA